jgi:hypothetical protein
MPYSAKASGGSTGGGGSSGEGKSGGMPGGDGSSGGGTVCAGSLWRQDTPRRRIDMVSLQTKRIDNLVRDSHANKSLR